MIDAVIISDLHLGSPSSRPKDVLRFLHRYARTCLVVAGDLLDGNQTSGLTPDEWKVLHRLAVRRDWTWVRGNHDEWAGDVASLSRVRFFSGSIVTSSGKKFLVTHGHQNPVTSEPWDPYLSKSGIPTNALNFLEGGLALLSRPLAGWFRRFRKDFYRPDNQVRDHAVRFLSQNPTLSGIVCGHTHRADTGDGYYNIGAWCEEVCTFGIVEDGRVRVEEFR